MFKKIFILLLVSGDFFFIQESKAAGPPMGPPTGPPCCFPPPCTCPLDGGLSFLIVAGAGLAGKKLYKSRKSKKENPVE